MTRRTLLPGIEVSITEHKRFPCCRPDFRTFYRPGYTRITIRVLDSHLFARNRITFFDFVRVSSKWNVAVAECETAPLMWAADDEEILKIRHYYATRNGKDYDLIRFFLQSQSDNLCRTVVHEIEHDMDVEIPLNQ